jgi:N-acetyl-anhydromuramyl-L-alanine amidase AmpD
LSTAHLRPLLIARLLAAGILLVGLSWISFHPERSESAISEMQTVLMQAGEAPSPAEMQATLKPAVSPLHWSYIVLHHSATVTGDLETFRADHLRRGWSDVGYHFVVRTAPAGSAILEISRRWKLQKWGAHAGNVLMNERGIGICVVGDFSRPTQTLTRQQAILLNEVIASLQGSFRISDQHVLLHREITATFCPGVFFPGSLIDSLRRRGSLEWDHSLLRNIEVNKYREETARSATLWS